MEKIKNNILIAHQHILMCQQHKMLSMTFQDEEKMTPGHYTLQNPSSGLRTVEADCKKT